MATTTVNSLTALTSADSGDKIPIWDISAGQYKAITKTNLVGGAMSGTSLTIPQTTVDVGQDLWIADPANPTSKNFILRVENAIFNGVRDTTYQLGFNRGGTDRDFTQACMYLQWEDHYQYGPANSRSEFFLQTFAPSGIGGALTRPWQVNQEHQTDTVLQAWQANQHSFYFRGAYAAQGTYYLNLTGDVVSIGGCGIRIDTNNVSALSQANAAVNAFPNLIKMTSTNLVQVGESGYGLYSPAASRFDAAATWYTGGGDGTFNAAITLGYVDPAVATLKKHYIKSSHAAQAALSGVVVSVNTGTDSVNADVLTVLGNKCVGINDTTPDATLDIVTADAAAVPVLLLEQLDVSEPFIKFVGASTTDNSQSLIDAANLATPGAIVGWAKVYVEDVQGTGPITDGVYWIPFYATPTA